MPIGPLCHKFNVAKYPEMHRIAARAQTLGPSALIGQKLARRR
jgi:hypothetical protein